MDAKAKKLLSEAQTAALECQDQQSAATIEVLIKAENHETLSLCKMLETVAMTSKSDIFREGLLFRLGVTRTNKPTKTLKI